MSVYVTLVSASATHPRYHRHGKMTGGGDLPLIFHTACGKKIDRMWGISSIQENRAALFATPCLSCFPVDSL